MNFLGLFFKLQAPHEDIGFAIHALFELVAALAVAVAMAVGSGSGLAATVGVVYSHFQAGVSFCQAFGA